MTAFGQSLYLAELGGRRRHYYSCSFFIAESGIRVIEARVDGL